MKWLYLSLDIGTLLCPLLLSFDKHVRYFKSWKNSLLAAIIIAIPFLIWDALFTHHGFWGFTPEYLSGIYIFNLPIEEILFFIIVPFACTFVYEVIKYFFRNYKLRTFNRFFLLAIPVYALSLVLMGDLGYYTLSVVISSTLVLAWQLKDGDLRYVGLAFLFSLIPFFIVNGVLTGYCTNEPVVWYSEAQKVTPRLFTIPMEDILYSYTLMVANILLFERLQRKGA
ncbi:MAG: lycopene cyclase domain-containing protein [Crocinitomicaceae bacterium]|nr:lycopene cyclase domain-containing protein [Crocinitomicaceae bacterium]